MFETETVGPRLVRKLKLGWGGLGGGGGGVYGLPGPPVATPLNTQKLTTLNLLFLSLESAIIIGWGMLITILIERGMLITILLT